MKRTLINILAAFLGVLVFLAIVILFGLLLTVVVTLLMQIEIVALVIRCFVTYPISNGWFIDETTALFAVLGIPVYYYAFRGAYYVTEKIGKNNYLPFLVVGVVLMIVYIPSGILALLAREAFWANIYGTIVGAYFIKEALQLYKIQ